MNNKIPQPAQGLNHKVNKAICCFCFGETGMSS
jgi:hypothetical protein